ncbi:V-type ATP synthase subunit D [Oscillibacter sp. MSJ-2]|uniref:V-type ATP synthase subunit D n=1 Tax=Dysosmobacter acutus TaxID=2841504 RepID=A0ABS6F712_9FIRM|nr:V-type ATP synthase subunit D [Dysosmobacter acutus]
MSQQIFATKGNLIAAKKSLALSSMGFDLLDRKRNVLIREMMSLLDQSRQLRREIGSTYQQAYEALAKANQTLGSVGDLAQAAPVDHGIGRIRFRSVMGVDIPIVEYEEPQRTLSYGLHQSNSLLDNAYCRFCEAKRMTALLAEVENSAFRLAQAIVKTQRRANALKNVSIPTLESTVKFITDALEEKEREEFSRLKVIKRQKQAQRPD